MFLSELYENFDFLKTCRLCLSQNNELVSILDISSFGIQYLIIISECTGLMIYENDKLPKNICLECVESLNNIYEFRKKAVKSERHLNDFLNQCYNNLNKNVMIENLNNIKTEVDSDQDSEYPVCPIESQIGLQILKDDSNIEIKTEFVEEKFEIDEYNPPVTEPTSIRFSPEENDNTHVLTSTDNSFQFSVYTICGERLASSNDLNLHLKNCTKQNKSISDTNKEVSSSPQLTKYKKNNNRNGKYICVACGKRFSLLNILKTHEKIHRGEKLFKCNLCGKCFTQMNHLNNHEKVHTGERPYVCKQCGKCFSQPSTLSTHEKSIHADERPHRCKVCGKSYINSSYLKRHERMHTGERPYVCDQCGKSFTHSSTLKRHRDGHKDERRYKCDQCKKTFKFSVGLRLHKKIHKDKKSESDN